MSGEKNEGGVVSCLLQKTGGGELKFSLGKTFGNRSLKAGKRIFTPGGLGEAKKTSRGGLKK